MQYLKNFETTSETETYVNGEDVCTPSVILNKETDEITWLKNLIVNKVIRTTCASPSITSTWEFSYPVDCDVVVRFCTMLAYGQDMIDKGIKGTFYKVGSSYYWNIITRSIPQGTTQIHTDSGVANGGLRYIIDITPTKDKNYKYDISDFQTNGEIVTIA